MRSQKYRTTPMSWLIRMMLRPEPIAELEQQVEDLRPERAAECRGRLVGHDQARVRGHGPGDADPLPLAAAEGVRVAVHDVGRKIDVAQQRRDPVADPAALAEPMDAQRLGDDLACGPSGAG
ncbi:MAG: hypothetical protein R3C69_14925 [Geminicoccaceae bacterium]